MKKLIAITVLLLVNVAFGQRLLNWPNDTIKVNKVIANNLDSAITPEMFGAKVNDTVDDATAIRNALVAANGAPVKFRSGYYVINSPISMNNVVSPKLIGTGVERGNATTFYCKNIAGYTLQWTGGSSPSSIKIQGIYFDGSNGSVYANSSTTWLGMMKSSIIIAHIFIDECKISYSKTINAKAINLDSTFYVECNRVFVSHFPFGYGIYSSPPGFFSTTYNFNKSYFTYIRQIGYFVENSGIAFKDCVFESCVTGIATAFVSNVTYDDCHFEQLGYDVSSTGIKKGLSIKVNRSDTMNTAVYDHCGNVVMTNCNFLYTDTWTATDTTRLRGWFEGSGSGSIYGGNGSARFISCRRGLGSTTFLPFFYNGATRAGYKYIVQDAFEAHNRGGVLRLYKDIRKVDEGFCQIATLNDIESHHGINISHGKMKFGCDWTKTYTGRPYFNLLAVDTNGVDTVVVPYEIGDEVKVTSPEQYGYEKAICTQAGVDGPLWTAKAAKIRWDVVTPTSYNGKYYRCVVAGRTKGTEPTWSTTVGDTVTDSLCKWICAGTASIWSWSGGYTIPENNVMFNLLTNTDTTYGYYGFGANGNEFHEWKVTCYENNILRGAYTFTVGYAASGIYWHCDYDGLAENSITPYIVKIGSKYQLSFSNETAYTQRVMVSFMKKEREAK